MHYNQHIVLKSIRMSICCAKTLAIPVLYRYTELRVLKNIRYLQTHSRHTRYVAPVVDVKKEGAIVNGGTEDEHYCRPAEC